MFKTAESVKASELFVKTRVSRVSRKSKSLVSRNGGDLVQPLVVCKVCV